MQSFREYVQVERLDGENKYDAGDYGMQPAEKGVKFVSFPPVLHLQLMRFQYDATLDANVKINDKFAFPDKLCLKEFMEGNGEDYTYCLHAVLVHSGDFHGGHYVVFINTGLRPPGEKYKPKWCKFDDDVVSRATVREAVMANYGGDDGESTGRTYTNAYMLVYVRQSCIDEVLCQHENLEVPAHLVQRFENEREEENKKKKEKQEAHLYTEIVMVTDEHLTSYNGFDLVDPKLLDDTGLPREKIEKSMTIPQLYDYVKTKLFSKEHEIETPAREMFRIWKFEETTYKDEGSVMSALPRLRPTSLIPHSEETQEKTLEAVLESDRNLLYIEASPANSLRSYNENSEMLMFLKYYDEQSRTLRYVGHFIVAYRQCIPTLVFSIYAKLFQEVAPDRIRLIESLGKPLCADNTVVEVSDGGLLIAERQDRTNETNNAKLHLDTLYNTIDIEAIANNDSFVSNNAELDPPITGTIGLVSSNWTMRQLVDYIGKEINYDPAKILLWRVSPFNDRATQFLTDSQSKALRVNGLLGLAGAQLHDPRRNKRCMPIPIADMERKRQMKIQMMDEKMNITEITIFPEKIGTVRDILEEARREFKFAPNGTGKLRLVYVGQSSQSMRAYTIFKEETSVMEGRVEEVPQDQLVVRSNEYLVPIAHFDKDPGRMFGVPFFLKVANDELLSSVRERIQARLDVPDKEYEKYKFALISSSRVVRYLDMTSNGRVNLAELGHAHVASPDLRCSVMGNGVDEKDHTGTKKTLENALLRNDVTNDMEVESKDLVIIQQYVKLKPEKEVESETDVENGEMDVGNSDTIVEDLEVNTIEDSASEEYEIYAPPDAAMEVNVSCDEECAERIKKFVDLPGCESDYMTEEEDDPDDVYKPESTIYLDIDRFSEFCNGQPETQLRLSKPVIVQGLQWKILAMPRGGTRVGTGTQPYKALGFFVQCYGYADAAAWNCSARIIQKVLAQTKDRCDHCEMVNFKFNERTFDWGCWEFLSCDFLLNPENGFIKDDTIRLAVHVSADAPRGVQCLLNPVVYLLFFTVLVVFVVDAASCKITEGNIFNVLYWWREAFQAVYDMPVSQNNSEDSVALAMQRVFYDLQHSDQPVNTRKLTKSFGWNTVETLTQHDVQELCRVLLDNLESKMKKSPAEDEIPSLFRGIMKSYIRCINVNFESTKEEPFYDIQLNIKGKCNIMQSFREYVQVERLDGENKYDAGDYGMQPAEKGVKFVSFPPVLHLQLMRFQYDVTRDANRKINDKFVFPDKLCLDEFMEENGEDYTYCLHAVLVHSGDVHGGHYVVFINTGLRPPGEKYKPKVCCSMATVRDAVMANYGGDDSESTGRTYTNAYMLVYVRQSCIDEVLCQHENLEVPAHLVQRFENEREEESKKKKEKQEAHLYTEIVMVTDEHLTSYNGFDLVDPKLLDDTGLPREIIEKCMTIAQLYEYVKTVLFSNEHVMEVASFMCFFFHYDKIHSIWKFEDMSYKEEGNLMSSLPRLRPTLLIPHSEDTQETTLEGVLESDQNFLYIEAFPANTLKSYNENSEMLMFLKYYDEQSRTLRCVGHFTVAYRHCMSAYANECLKLIGLPENTPLRFYEEVAPDRIRLIENLGKPLCADNTVIELSDGGLLIAERLDRTNETNNAKLHLDTLYNTIDIEAVANNDSFVSNNAELDPPITGTIGLNWTMPQLVDYIGKEINYDPAKILLWQVSPFSGRATRFITESQWEVGGTNKTVKNTEYVINLRYRVIYTKMPILIADIKRKRQMKVQMMDEKMNITEITIFPEKIGTVRDILEEARREFKFAPNGTGKLRLVYVGQSSQSKRAYTIFKEETSVMEVFQKTMTSSMYMVVVYDICFCIGIEGRVEEVPQDQLVVGSNEYLVPIAHFDNDPGRMFGIPFFLKVTNDELLSSVRERIQARLDVPDKEYEKYKFALIFSSRVVRYLDMTSNGRVNLAELGHAHVASLASSLYLGLDHMNKSRGACGSHAAEKALVIHN
ncbi:unnamed protein product [Angiostrongylus costaricensis]|uniref:Ubiquitin carboxyl-terminal hydrolase 7 n=1 Tax=Angiostrongylus costaricensis TaxID=334426 RepID=A0A0R3PY34_ANGCS|nr:unnamed protein product [Angiostrongylus costaricensis]